MFVTGTFISINQCTKRAHCSNGEPAIGVEGGGAGQPPRPPATNVAPPGWKFQPIHESLSSLSCKHIFL